ncbi:MAG TPA: septum formation initiator family protein [Salinarimonas sp.]|jgi:cell division protein FtsB|nr:septum formation initiator family protein [Salinarimonas sp.]
MVVRKRARAFILPLVLYGIAAALVGYFVHHAHNGSRGLEAKRTLKAQIAGLSGDLAVVKAERAEWDRRIALLRSDQIDRDLLEERARTMLGRVHRNDLVIITGP